MKQTLIAGLASMMLAQGALGYINQGVVIDPDFNINDPVFVNDRGAQFLVYNLLDSPYRTYNTRYYTNNGLMEAFVGYQFDTFVPTNNRTECADWFFNDSFGVINCTQDVTAYSTNQGLVIPAKCLVNASNIVSRGQINAGRDGYIFMHGRNLDLVRGRMGIAAFENGLFSNDGIFDYHWGETNLPMNPAVRFGFFPNPPSCPVTNRYYLTNWETLLVTTPAIYVGASSTGPSNVTYNVVCVQNGNPAFTINAYEFNGRDTAVEWVWPVTDPLTGALTTNYLYLYDTLGTVTNVVMKTNGIAPPSTGFRPTFIPTNYSISLGGPQYPGTQLTPGDLPPYPNTNLNVQTTIYRANFQPLTSVPSEFTGRSFTNMPGRVEITATNVLDLSRARITGLNTLVVKATNHFVGAGMAKIVTPFADLELGSTNGSLSVSNLLYPVVPRLEGVVSVWSTEFTNVAVVTNLTVATVTYRHHITVVDSQISPSVPPRLQNLSLRSTNVFISDALNVLSNLVIDAEHLTIGTNAPGAANPFGQLNLLNSQIFWPSATPRLLTLTNYGYITTANSAYFGSPSAPYEAFVNHGPYGVVFSHGSWIRANYFENSGWLYAWSSAIELGGSQTAWLHDGWMYAPGGDITLNSGSLVISNHSLQAGGAITLSATSLLDDGTVANSVAAVTNKNTWTASAGFNLLSRPANSSLLGTTVFSSSPPSAEVVSTWAGQDRGAVPEGFFNNAALGQLVLDGGDVNSLFVFQGANASNALYVDHLELRNWATNQTGWSDFHGLSLLTNMRIYYAEATINGVSIAEKMNHANGDRLRWVAGYAGFYSSTNVVYPDGTTNQLNAALVRSANLDSDGDGTENYSDETPVLAPSQFAFSIARTNAPAGHLVLSWKSVPDAPNTVEYATNLAAPAWLRLTNFVSGPAMDRAAVLASPNQATRFYRVRVERAPTMRTAAGLADAV